MVAPWVHAPRLELMLGTSINDVSWSTIENLVRRGVAEDLTLEFKRQTYGSSDAGKQELCKDVAGMANAGGGLIIIGLAEDGQGRAESIHSVDDPEGVASRLTQTILGGVQPLVRDLTIWDVRSPDADNAVLLLLVPASDTAPHGVRRGDAFAWPVRHDTLTRWMAEPELASRYRDRFRAAQDTRHRLDDVASEGLARLDRANNCWLALTVTPSRPGRLPADRDRYRTWLGGAFNDLPVSASSQTALLGRQRIVFTDQWQFRGTSKDHHIELHADGAAFGAVVVNERQRIADLDRLQLPEHLAFDTDSVTAWVTCLLRVLAAHAINTGAGGDLAVRATLVPGKKESGSGAATKPAALPLLPTEPFTLADGGYFGQRILPGAMPLDEPSALNLFAPPSIVTDAHDLISVASEIVHELIAEFGSIPTHRVLRTDGTVARRPPENMLAGLFGWARNQAVLTDD